jgi:hypothetical protein
MKPRSLAMLIVILALIAIVFLWTLTSFSPSPEIKFSPSAEDEARQRQAMERWGFLVRQGTKKHGVVEFKGENIEKTFRLCFRYPSSCATSKAEPENRSNASCALARAPYRAG